MSFLKIPSNIHTVREAHKKWLQIIKDAQELVEKDVDLQDKAAKGLRLKERHLPPEVLGRNYAQYCNLINRMYDAYLNNVQLQRGPYILEIISIFLKRMYELRNELVHLIVNDYIYVDASLAQTGMIPTDIQIVVPYHFPLECRSETIEQLLQKIWADALKRKNASYKMEKTPGSLTLVADGESRPPDETSESIDKSEPNSEHTIIPEEYIQTNIIQKHERFRQYFIEDYRSQCRERKAYAVEKALPAPLQIRISASNLIKKVYREYMKMKRLHARDLKRDIMMGLTWDPFKDRLKFKEENNKIYEERRKIRQKIQKIYIKELEQEKTRLILFKKDNQIDDITEHIIEWFKEWYYGYGFFPEYPYDVEGGTIMVVRGDYPSVEEKKEADEKYLAATKGKTKEQIQHEKEQAKADAQMKAQLAKEQKQKELEQLFKMRCNPVADPGYEVQTSSVMDSVVETLQKYRASWSIYDRFPPDQCAEIIYGYMKPLLTEELMSQIHKDCRIYVDELMRLELKLLIKAQQQMYKLVGWKFPKLKPRKKPKSPSVPKPLNMDDKLLQSLGQIFDLGIISKPTTKIEDIYGDFNYAAYELNLMDPDAKFPPPGYGDIRRRLVLSCVFGAGIEPGAKRNKAVMLMGPERNGKSFLVDAVAGEMNAVKIDISPEVFSAVLDKPAKVLTQVFLAAKVFQPSVIFMKNVERVFYKKVPPEEKYLNAKVMKNALAKSLKVMSPDDKIIFIATCSNPFSTQPKPMVSLFNEMILVPRTDYGSLQRFFSEKFQCIRSMPRDYCVQALAQMLQGYGFGVIVEVYNKVMTSERIVRLSVTPLSPSEFLEPLLESEIEPITMEEYQEYLDFFISNSPLKVERNEFETINAYRAVAYKKLAKEKKGKEPKN